MDLYPILSVRLFCGGTVDIRQRSLSRGVLVEYPQRLPGDGKILRRDATAIAQNKNCVCGRRHCGKGPSGRCRWTFPALLIEFAFIAQILNLIAQTLDL